VPGSAAAASRIGVPETAGTRGAEAQSISNR